MSESPKKTCPECGKKKLRRLIGPGGAVIFKGSGFHGTDYRSESYKKAAAADKSDGAAASSDGKKPSDDKSAEGKKPPDGKSTETKKPAEGKGKKKAATA